MQSPCTSVLTSQRYTSPRKVHKIIDFHIFILQSVLFWFMYQSVRFKIELNAKITAITGTALSSVLKICRLSFWRTFLPQLMTFRSERLCEMKQNQEQPMQKGQAVFCSFCFQHFFSNLEKSAHQTQWNPISSWRKPSQLHWNEWSLHLLWI